jgi:hypothetical protein
MSTAHLGPIARMILDSQHANLPPIPADPTAIGFDTEALYTRLDRARRTQRASWRKVAAAAGVSPSAISRLAYGQAPSVDNLLRLLIWLGDTDTRPYIKDTR